MLDIASVLEKSNDPSFVQFRKCRDMIFNEGKAVGKLEGELKGRLEAQKSTLLRILAKRLGPVPPSLQEQICQIEDMQKLEELIDQAISVKDIEEIKL